MRQAVGTLVDMGSSSVSFSMMAEKSKAKDLSCIIKLCRSDCSVNICTYYPDWRVWRSYSESCLVVSWATLKIWNRALSLKFIDMRLFIVRFLIFATYDISNMRSFIAYIATS